jgi:peptidoglycan/LPS O-acetylase OafA/YrhL
MSVVVSHTRVLGFGGADLFGSTFRNQQALGGLAVAGFFVLSGMLITRSARRTKFLRYAWHRCLRIFPGLWVCLAVTAFAVAPLLAMRQNGSLRGFWTEASRPGGPVHYVSANMWSGVQQYGIRDLLVQTTPWGRLTHGSAFDGPLWSLVYEMLCYVVIGSLLVTGVLRNARRFVPFLALALYVRIIMDFRLSASWGGGEAATYQVFYVDYLGYVDWRWITYLGFLFMAAGALELYREKVPVHDGLGVLSLVLAGGSLLFGGWFVIGYPAFVYLMVWAAVRAPRWTHWVGRKNDYSYGVYIYGFVGQQVMASLGWTRWGYFPYLLMSMGVAFAAAFLSWHLVEKHCLKLKNWTPGFAARWKRVARDRFVPAPRRPADAPAEPAPVPVG